MLSLNVSLPITEQLTLIFLYPHMNIHVQHLKREVDARNCMFNCCYLVLVIHIYTYIYDGIKVHSDMDIYICLMSVNFYALFIGRVREKISTN